MVDWHKHALYIHFILLMRRTNTFNTSYCYIQSTWKISSFPIQSQKCKRAKRKKRMSGTVGIMLYILLVLQEDTHQSWVDVYTLPSSPLPHPSSPPLWTACENTSCGNTPLHHKVAERAKSNFWLLLSIQTYEKPRCATVEDLTESGCEDYENPMTSFESPKVSHTGGSNMWPLWAIKISQCHDI